MPILKEYKLRRATKNSDIPEITVPMDWCRYHGKKIGDTVKMFADSVLVVLPDDDAELEQRVREILESGELRTRTGQKEEKRN